MFALLSCSTQPSAGPTGTPTATPLESAKATSSPSTAPPLIVVAETNSSGLTSQFKLYGLDGRLVTTFPLKNGVWPLAATGKRIFVQSSGRLKAIDRAGAVQDLGPIPAGPNEIANIIPSPDGTHWLWTSSSWTASAGIVSSIHEGGDGMSNRVVTVGTKASPIHAYQWTNAAILITHYPAFPFGIEAVTPFVPRWPFVSIDTMELPSGVLTPVAGSVQCKPGDISLQSVYACFVPNQKLSGSGDATQLLRLAPSSGSAVDVNLPQPQFTEAGAAWFSPSGSTLALAGWNGTGHFGYPGQPLQPPAVGIHSYLVNLSGTVTPFGPEGAQPALGPQTWIPGGAILLMRQRGAVGGDPGLFVLDANGQGPFIRDSGRPVGILS